MCASGKEAKSTTLACCGIGTRLECRVTKREETAEERKARIAKLTELYREGRFDEVLIPEDADPTRLMEDLASGSSVPERKLFDLVNKSHKK